MAFRGRGRGRGGFGGGFGFRADKQEPFKLFPEDVALPDRKGVTLDEDFVKWNYKLQTYFESSAYVVEVSASQDSQSYDIERYSDWNKPRNKTKRESLTNYMKLEPGYFPVELVRGVKTHAQKKVKWDTDQDYGKRSDLFEGVFEKLKNKFKEQQDRDPRDKNKNENDEDHDEADVEEEEEEYSDDGDYEQNRDFDDDEDDFNDNDDGDDEPFY